MVTYSSKDILIFMLIHRRDGMGQIELVLLPSQQVVVKSVRAEFGFVRRRSDFD